MFFVYISYIDHKNFKYDKYPTVKLKEFSTEEELLAYKKAFDVGITYYKEVIFRVFKGEELILEKVPVEIYSYKLSSKHK